MRDINVKEHNSYRDQHIDGTEMQLLSLPCIVAANSLLTIKAVKNGESEQKTDVFVGALIPSASVPLLYDQPSCPKPAFF